MERLTWILNVALNPSNSAPHFKVAASLLLSPSSKALAVPSMNAIFFKGDRVQGTRNPAIDRLSESKNIAEILVSKLGDSVNVCVVEASTFNGPFAVFKDFVPTVNSRGEPKHYDPEGFPASSSIVKIISKSIDQVRSTVSVGKNISPIPEMRTPKTAMFGFSKGGTVINQIVAELANKNAIDAVTTDSQTLQTRNSIFPASKDSFLHSISEFHYVDVGLNCRGAYLTDRAAIDQVARDLTFHKSSLRFVLHGTPRQWCDLNRPWIREEKDSLVQLLRDAGEKYGGGMQYNASHCASFCNRLRLRLASIDRALILAGGKFRRSPQIYNNAGFSRHTLSQNSLFRNSYCFHYSGTFTMSQSSATSHMTHQTNLPFTVQSDSNVPPNMRDYYYFAVLLNNLPHATTSEVLRSLYGSLSGCLHASVDIDTDGNPTETGELIFADESSMQAAANLINGQHLHGNNISAQEFALFDVKPEFYLTNVN